MLGGGVAWGRDWLGLRLEEEEEVVWGRDWLALRLDEEEVVWGREPRLLGGA